MATTEDYQELNRRLTEARERAAVLRAQEATLSLQREIFVQELTMAGVDVTHPEAELARLEQEAQIHYETAKATLDTFERALTHPSVAELRPIKPAEEVVVPSEVDLLIREAKALNPNPVDLPLSTIDSSSIELN